MLHTFFSVLAPTCYLSVTISSLLPVTLYLPPIQYDLLSGPRMYLILSHVLAFKHPIPPPGMLSSPLTGHHLRRGVSLNPQTRGGLPSLQWAPALLWCVCVCVCPPHQTVSSGRAEACPPPPAEWALLHGGQPGQWCVNVHWTGPADCS